MQLSVGQKLSQPFSTGCISVFLSLRRCLVNWVIPYPTLNNAVRWELIVLLTKEHYNLAIIFPLRDGRNLLFALRSASSCGHGFPLPTAPQPAGPPSQSAGAPALQHCEWKIIPSKLETIYLIH